MKTAKLLFAFFLFVSIISFTRCTTDHNFSLTTQETLTHNNWSVDYYFESQDLTSEYGGYNLLFSSTGIVSVQRGNEVISGNWSNGSDADNSEIITISFTTTDASLNKLNQSWKLTGQTNSTLQFEDNTNISNPSQLRIKKQ